MKNFAQTRIVLPPVPLPWYRRVDWWFTSAILLSGSITVFVILCAAKAVR